MSNPLLSPYWPFAVLMLGIVAVVVMISRLRFHAFIALMLAAVFVGLISQHLPAPAGQHSLVAAVELPMAEFGSLAGKIAWVIALAAIIGTAMMESGAADKIVNALLQLLGEKRAALALLLSGFVLSIPVFFDTVFFLLIPLARALGMRTGRHYVQYVLVIGGGAMLTHSLVPPTPGPLIMAETLHIDLGLALMAGLGITLLPAGAVGILARWIDRRRPIPIREQGGSDAHQSAVYEPMNNLPGLLESLLPVMVPIVLIGLSSVVEGVKGEVPGWVAFWGNKNVAMLVGAVLALGLWARMRGLKLRDLGGAVGGSLEVAGVIILITSAGGAFGAMIKHAGIGDAIALATAHFPVPYLLLGWGVSAVMKTAQGSSTVAMITTSSILAPLIGTGEGLPYHPVYVYLAIGFGSACISWMNDSAFWVVAKLSGFTEKETLQSWTLLLGLVSVLGLLLVMLLAWWVPG